MGLRNMPQMRKPIYRPVGGRLACGNVLTVGHILDMRTQLQQSLYQIQHIWADIRTVPNAEVLTLST